MTGTACCFEFHPGLGRRAFFFVWRNGLTFAILFFERRDSLTGEKERWTEVVLGDASDTSDKTFTVLASAWGIEKLRNILRTVNLGQLSDWIRFGPTIVSNATKGPGAKGAVRTWAIKGGGVNPNTGFRLPFHYHIHRYNWYKPWTWFKQTPILK